MKTEKHRKNILPDPKIRLLNILDMTDFLGAHFHVLNWKSLKIQERILYMERTSFRA
jgi:hypothetical protein